MAVNSENGQCRSPMHGEGAGRACGIGEGESGMLENRTARHQYLTNGVSHKIVNRGAVTETYFGLRRVHVHIYFAASQFKNRSANGKQPGGIRL